MEKYLRIFFAPKDGYDKGLSKELSSLCKCTLAVSLTIISELTISQLSELTISQLFLG